MGHPHHSDGPPAGGDVGLGFCYNEKLGAVLSYFVALQR